MCGRYLFYDDLKEDIARLLFEASKLADFSDSVCTKEIFPTNKTIICIQDLKPKISTWGFDKWDNKGCIINARVESLKTSKFYNPYLNNRCIIMASGYYEWNKNKDKFYHYTDNPIYMAGLINDKNQFVIITKDATGELMNIHNRCPLIYTKNDALRYLNNENIDTLVSNEKEIRYSLEKK